MNRSAPGRLCAVLISLPLLFACQDLSVTVVPVSRVEVVPGAAILGVGESLALEAIPTDASGTPLSGRSVVWTVRDPSLALVSSIGMVHALGAGIAVVEATSEGVTGASEIQILNPEPAPPPDTADDPTDGGGDDDSPEDGDGGDDDEEPGNNGKGKGRPS